eukprot:354792-Chlamydomonas_euryale.AAC.5
MPCCKCESLHRTMVFCPRPPPGHPHAHLAPRNVQVPFGQVVRVCGSNEAFGAWKLDKAPKLKWHDGHVWRATMTIPVGETMKFKVCTAWHLGAWRAWRAWWWEWLPWHAVRAL